MGTQKEIRRETTVKETTIETITENSATSGNQNDVQKLLDECQSYHYAQSSKFSTLARTLVFGIIGTIWILSYSTNGFNPSNNCLLWSLIVSFLYLAVDLCHYFWDSCFYRSEYFKFEKEKDISEHDKRMRERSQLSNRAIWVKSIIFIFVCGLFIGGFVKQYDVISKLFN